MIQPVRTIGIAASFVLFSAGAAAAQRGGGLPRIVSVPTVPAPAGRMGTPEDVAKAVLYLCSPAAAWIRGQTIVCDGGLSLL